MKIAKPYRFTLISLLCFLLALGLGLQSAGIALTRKAPVTAAALFPLNGLAQENIASATYASSVEISGGPEVAAQSAEMFARFSYLKEPLTPESHAILGLAEAQGSSRTAVVNLASTLNRREPTLQGLVLQEHVLAKNYSGVVETLDGILRVRPSRSAELYPILLAVFAQDGAVEEFSKVLDGSSPWHQRFVNYAVGQPAALTNLVELRSRQSFDDEKLDQALLSNLAKEGDLETSYALYRQLSDAEPGGRSEGTLSWVSTFQPFDWGFADTAEIRAQTSQDSDELELYIRPGNGGIFAKRIVKAPESPFMISAQLQISPRNLSKDVKILVTCAESSDLILEAAFSEGSFSHSVNSLPLTCPYLELALHGRAWSGQSALRGAIPPLRISKEI